MTLWLVGMDLRATSMGALRYSSWLHGRGSDATTLHAVHVLEQLEQHFAIKLALHSRRRLVELTREATLEVLRESSVESCFEQIDVLPGGAADEVLDEQRVARGAAGLVVGRQGPLYEGFIPRLGRVARRLLRHAGGPVIVVPPDLELDRLEGPVVLATDLGSSSAAAARFAVARAREWGRPLRVVHVLRDDTGGLSFLPRNALEGARATMRREQRQAAEQWMAQQPFEGVDVELELPAGSAVDALRSIVRRGSPLAVCGARRLSWLKRQLRASHATTLSAHAPVPVAVVPPERSDSPEPAP